MKTHVILAALIALPISLATAADEASAPAAKPKMDPATVFKKFDRDANGTVSLEEYKQGMAGQIGPDRIEGIFKKKDADGDGKLSLPEFMFIPARDPLPMPTPFPKEKKEKKE